LMPYTQEIPKPLIQLGSKRAIDYLIEKYSEVANAFYINIGYIGDLLKFYLRGKYPKHTFHFIDEEEPKGTGTSFMKVFFDMDLERPIIFTFCDVLTQEDFPLDKDLLVVNNEQGVFGWYKNVLEDSEIKKNPKPKEQFKNGITGIGVVMHPRDMKRACLLNVDKKEVEFTLDILNEYHKTHPFATHPAQQLFEFGEIKPYEQTRNFFNEHHW